MPKMQLSKIIHQLSYMLIPGSCQLCGLDSGRKFDLCIHCEAALPLNLSACLICALPLPGISNQHCPDCIKNVPPLDRCYAGFVFDSHIKTMIHRIKFQQGSLDSYLLSCLFARQLKLEYAGQDLPEVLLPVPLSYRRLLKRGYNQSACIARHLGRELGIPVKFHALKRITNTSPQTGLSRSSRAKNLRAAFKPKSQLTYKSVVLIDDVMTTGATLFALAEAIRRETGVKTIHAWVLARTPQQRKG